MPPTGIDFTINEPKMNNMSGVFRTSAKQLEEVSQALVKLADTMERGAFEGAAAREFIDTLKNVAAKNTFGLSQKMTEMATDIDEVVALYKRAVRQNMANKGKG